MSDRTINEKGEILVTTTDVSTLEDRALDREDLLYLVFKELRKMNLHLASLSGEDITDKDVGD